MLQAKRVVAPPPSSNAARSSSRNRKSNANDEAAGLKAEPTPLNDQIGQIRLPRVNRRHRNRSRVTDPSPRELCSRSQCGTSHDHTANLFRKPVLDDILLLAMLGSVPAVRRSRTLSK